MIDRASDRENAVDLIVAHLHSRFFRDSFGFEFYVPKLTKHDLKFVSINREFNDGCEAARARISNIAAFFLLMLFMPIPLTPAPRHGLSRTSDGAWFHRSVFASPAVGA